MLSAQTNSTVIGRLRIRSNASDPYAEQQRISRLLKAASLHPANLSRSAILVVRRLTDPLPARLRAGPFDARPDPSWQRAYSAAMDKFIAAAAHPVLGPVPGDADAVLFEDYAEVLASLASDWLSGSLHNLWWWREILRGQDDITGLLKAWIEAPEYVPPALEILCRRSRSVPFVQRVPEAATELILNAMLRVHQVPQPDEDDDAPTPLTGAEPIVPHPEKPPVPAREGEQDRRHPPTIAHRSPEAHWSAIEAPPWRSWVPEAATPSLSPLQKTLLVQALMLRRAPSIVRSRAFQREFRKWRIRAERGQKWSSTWVAQHSTNNAPSPPAEPVNRSGTEEKHHHPAGDATQASSARPVRTPATASDPQLPESPGVPLEADGTAPAFDGPPPVSPPADGSTRTQPSAPRDPLQEAPLELTLQRVASIETEYGGVFFLLNMALYLSLYGDFTTPSDMGLELNIWDFLALLATHLTGGEIASDPLWPTLASLAGRTPNQHPGDSFEPPAEWRIPPEWLIPFSDDYDRTPVLTAGRMIVMHPAGFAVLDVPADPLAPAPTVDGLQRWVTWIAGYCRARLVLSLGSLDAIRLLCHLPARVQLSNTHVDVWFSLDHHPIEIRRAGLDRDPGWIPAAGRYLAFHFD